MGLEWTFCGLFVDSFLGFWQGFSSDLSGVQQFLRGDSGQSSKGLKTTHRGEILGGTLEKISAAWYGDEVCSTRWFS